MCLFDTSSFSQNSWSNSNIVAGLSDGLIGEHLDAVVGHEERVLPLCAGLLVLGDDFPAVGVVGIDEDAPRTHVDHRLDGEDHAGHKEHACAAMAVVVDLGVFVEGVADAVTGQVADNAVAVLLTVLLDSVAYVADEAEGLGGLHAYLQALLGHTHQLFLLGCGLTDDEHAGGVGVVAVEDGGEVDVDDITLLKDVLLLGHAVTDHLVDAGADAHGERRGVFVAAVVEAGGNGVMLLAVATANLVNLQCGHAGTDVFGHLVEDAGVDDAGATDTLNLFGCLDEVTGGHKLALVLPIHDLFIEFCRLLSRETVPSAFLVLSHLNS